MRTITYICDKCKGTIPSTYSCPLAVSYGGKPLTELHFCNDCGRELKLEPNRQATPTLIELVLARLEELVVEKVEEAVSNL